jgi:hypothetical protein
MNHSSHTNRAIVTFLLLLAAFASPARAIDGAYRPGQPEVLAPALDEGADTERAIQSARRASTLRGRTVALYWNREPVQTDDSVVRQTTIDQWEDGSVTPTVPGGVAMERRGRTVVTERKGALEIEQPLRDGPGDHADGQLRSAFVQTLRVAGVRVVEAPRGKGAGGIRMVVLLVREPGATYGWSFRVSVTDAARSTVLADFTTIAEKGERTRSFVATGHGFQRRALTLHDVGETLALETLSNTGSIRS